MTSIVSRVSLSSSSQPMVGADAPGTVTMASGTRTLRSGFSVSAVEIRALAWSEMGSAFNSSSVPNV